LVRSVVPFSEIIESYKMEPSCRLRMRQ
jgi:hypothetical protein